jgi:hypothetical protein
LEQCAASRQAGMGSFLAFYPELFSIGINPTQHFAHSIAYDACVAVSTNTFGAQN